jgi:hypothetical protein
VVIPLTANCKSYAVLGLDAPVPNMGFCVSIASRNRFRRCTARGVNYRRSGHSLLEAHEAGVGSGRAFARAFNGLLDFSSCVASLNIACRVVNLQKMQAVSASARGTQAVPANANLLVPSHSLRALGCVPQDPHDRRERLILPTATPVFPA